MQRRKQIEIDLQELFPDPIIMRLVQPRKLLCSVLTNSVLDSARVLCKVLLQDHMFVLLERTEQRAIHYYAATLELNIEQPTQDSPLVYILEENSDTCLCEQLRSALVNDRVLDKNWKARLRADVESVRSARATLELLCRKTRLAYDAHYGVALDENGMLEYP